MLGQVERSGETVAAFARRTGIPAHRILRWRRRLRETETAGRAAQFVPVRVMAEARAEGAIEVVIAGRTVRVPAEFDEVALVRVLRAVLAA